MGRGDVEAVGVGEVNMFNNKKPDIVSCYGCKLLLSRSDTQKIKAVYGVLEPIEETRYYCPKDKKPYDHVRVYASYREAYYKEFEVSKEGEPIGYKKITK